MGKGSATALLQSRELSGFSMNHRIAGFSRSMCWMMRQVVADIATHLPELEAVHRKVLEAGNPGAEIVMHVGFFPDTAVELEDETFCFISLDVDKYKPTLAGLDVMFPRLEPGGYIFIHDYNSEESNRGVSRAVDEWIAGRPESVLDIPDQSGSIVIRKLKE